MEVTDVRIFKYESSANAKLKAYATITLDGAFVVRNLKVIEGSKGLFVAMPSERAKSACPKCGHWNAARSRFCNQCGAALNAVDQPMDHGGEGQEEVQAEHRETAHPITAECRTEIQKKVLAAYEKAVVSRES